MNMADGENKRLESFRPYLSMLARAHLDPRLEHKLDASDLVQQTLMDAHANRDQYRGVGDAQFAVWLKQILKNNLTDKIRQLQCFKRDVRRECALETAMDRSFAKVDDWLAASQTSPSGRAVKNEQLLRLARALEELPPPQRDAIVLHHLQGMKLAEVADYLAKSESAVGGLLFRGLKKLNEVMSS